MAASAVRQRLLALEQRYPAYLLTSLLPVPQSLRTLSALDASRAQQR